MKAIDHLVLAGHDLSALRASYAALGFTLTPPARHPFGTGNSLVQLQGSFLELLTVLEPGLIPEPQPGQFSFAAFNRDFLARQQGLSMLVLDSADARADVARFQAAGLAAYAPFDFSRAARLPDGGTVTVGFSLAFASAPGAPEAGFFCCQQHAPEHFWKPEYQRHANTAQGIEEVALVAANPSQLQNFLDGFTGSPGLATRDGLDYPTARGRLSVLTPEAYYGRYRLAPPDLARGPRFGGYTLTVASLDAVMRHAAAAGLSLIGARGRYVVSGGESFGAAIGFTQAKGKP